MFEEACQFCNWSRHDTSAARNRPYRKSRKCMQSGSAWSEHFSVYPACTSVRRIRCFWRSSRLVDSITYEFSASLLVRSPPPISNALSSDASIARPGPQVSPLMRNRAGIFPLNG
jgi:hypothetical protein